MKAKDYYAKYGADLIAEWEIEPSSTAVLTKLVADLYQEATELNKLRHGQTKGALFSAIGEQNEKWNSIVRMFEKKGQISPLKWNGFLNAAKVKFPDLFQPEITPEQILEAQMAIQRIQAKDMLDASKKQDAQRLQEQLKKIEDSVKEQIKERDLKNAKFV